MYLFGGKALKNVTTRRYDRAEFEAIRDELIPIFQKSFRVLIPFYYSSKESFGDIDVLVQIDGTEDIKKYITDTFKPNEIFHNGNCWSFDYKEFQIDFITSPEKHFSSNFMYLSYNDLGNMIGRLAHPFGLKYGQEGLWYEYYNNKGQKLGEIPISKDYPAIFKFLGLDFSRWERGFEKLEDIFEYVASSKYFDWRQYQMDTLNRINRERNLKRASYMTLLDWIETNGKKQEYDFIEDKSIYIPAIDFEFPEANLPTEIRRSEYEYAKKLYIQSKFNGNKITRKFGLEGAELGKHIVGFKKFMANIDPEPNINFNFNLFILDAREEVIWDWFERYLAF